MWDMNIMIWIKVKGEGFELRSRSVAGLKIRH